MLAATVAAVYDANYAGYSGVAGRERRLYDPYSRDMYFGEGYQKPFVNYGSKGPTYRVTNTGAKSAYSSVFNLETNTFTSQGRTPGRISNFDSGVRGYTRVDRYVDLLPWYPADQSLESLPVYPHGSARVISLGGPLGAADLNKPGPRTQLFITLKNLPPVPDNMIYEAWFFDAETEYPLSVGLMKNGIELTSSLFFEFRRQIEPFDAVVITREPYPDTNPMPNEIVLWGDIDPVRTNDGKLNTAALERLR